MLFRAYRKRKALERYQTELGQQLRGTYGERAHYEANSVAATARFYGFNDAFLCYALAMYADRESFDAYHAERGEACSYDRLWYELNTNVSVSDGSMNLSAMVAASSHEESAIDVGDAFAGSYDSPGISFDFGD